LEGNGRSGVGPILMNENIERDYRTNKKDSKISCFKIINMRINTVLETESQKMLN
jgi:hypothetical protein